MDNFGFSSGAVEDVTDLVRVPTVSNVLRLRDISLLIDAFELPLALRRAIDDSLAKCADVGRAGELLPNSLTLSIDSINDDPRLADSFSGFIWLIEGGDPFGVLFGELGGERLEISIMALAALLFSSPLESLVAFSILMLSAVTTGSATLENV
jgi:hypothetical protein